MGRRGPNATPVKAALSPLGQAGQATLFTGADDFSHLLDFNALPPKKRKKQPPLWLKVCDFIEQLPVTKGLLVGQKMRVWPWQREHIIKPIYATGGGRAPRRVVREAFISIPRKNGKTGLAAGLVLAHLCGPAAEPRGEIYSLGSDRAQASIIYNEVTAIRDQVPQLAARLIPREYEKEVIDNVTGTVYRALSADAPSKLGLSTSFFIYDEFGVAPNQKLWDAVATSTGARSNPLGLAISTQARDDSHPMSQMLDHALAVTKGEIDDPYTYGYLQAAPDDADPWDEDTWKDCNPGIGNIRSLEDLRFHATKARHIPSREASFRNYYLNQRIAAAAGFLPPTLWKNCYLPNDWTRDELKGETCFVGLDLAQVRDLLLDGRVFPEYRTPDNRHLGPDRNPAHQHRRALRVLGERRLPALDQRPRHQQASHPAQAGGMDERLPHPHVCLRPMGNRRDRAADLRGEHQRPQPDSVRPELPVNVARHRRIGGPDSRGTAADRIQPAPHMVLRKSRGRYRPRRDAQIHETQGQRTHRPHRGGSDGGRPGRQNSFDFPELRV